MNEIFPLFIALIGAAFGAYFAILKSKSEKLWVEKYEALKNIVNTAESIAHETNLSGLEVLGINTMTEAEKLSLTQETITSKNELRKSISQLKLLFKESDLEKLLDDYEELYGAIIKLKNMPPNEYRHDYHDDIQFKAIELVNSTVSLAQKKCT